MLDLKSYYLTILGIFLALGLGIVLGSTLVSSELLLNEQLKIVEKIEKEFSSLRRENKRVKDELSLLQASIEENQEFFAQVAPYLFKDVLSGQKFTIYYGEDFPGDSSFFLEALSTGGAEVFEFDGLDNERKDQWLIVLGHLDSKEKNEFPNKLYWDGDIEDPLQVFRLLWKIKEQKNGINHYSRLQ